MLDTGAPVHVGGSWSGTQFFCLHFRLLGLLSGMWTAGLEGVRQHCGRLEPKMRWCSNVARLLHGPALLPHDDGGPPTVGGGRTAVVVFVPTLISGPGGLHSSGRAPAMA